MGSLRGGARRRVALYGQIGEQGGPFFPGAGGQGLPGSLVEFVGRDPAGLEGHAQLGDRPVAVGIGHPEMVGRVAPAGSVHDLCSFGADSSVITSLNRFVIPAATLPSSLGMRPAEEKVHSYEIITGCGRCAIVSRGVSTGWSLTKKFFHPKNTPGGAAPVTASQVCCLSPGVPCPSMWMMMVRSSCRVLSC